MLTKKCSKCKENKSLDSFDKDSSKSDGLLSFCKSCRKSYRLQNLDKINSKGRQYYHKNIERNREKQNNRYSEIRKEVINKYGGKCACCGEYRLEFLAIDHVNGGGSLQRSSGMKGSKFYRWLYKNEVSLEYRVLCHNCNVSFGLYGYCPHG